MIIHEMRKNALSWYIMWLWTSVLLYIAFLVNYVRALTTWYVNLVRNHPSENALFLLV